ncbi:MAG: GNAT family N-acetyltransferase [Gammaproteobacteria bacterium]|nr:GNAT family N-acetyltransferase [Gammaproteobacteria bacterium]MDH5653954.1 GNAT family N-acetyltransferase [Gammaproteobacteria bacterium]
MSPINATPVLLRDQTPVNLSLIQPSDRIRLLNGFARISPRTNIQRFHTFKKQFTESELNYLLAIDNVNHLAVGAIDINGATDIGIGLARYVRDVGQPSRADAAIIVIDAYQGKGLGRLLYAEILKFARLHGIRQLSNTVLKGNRAMLHLLAAFGAVRIAEDEHVLQFLVRTDSNHEVTTYREDTLPA